VTIGQHFDDGRRAVTGGDGALFPIRFDGWYRVLSSAVLIRPSRSDVVVRDAEVLVRMDWAFRARFPRSAVVAANDPQLRPLSRGVHGFAGRWLVNGSAQGLVAIDLDPTQRAFVLGFPLRLRRLVVSVERPEALLAALRRSS
jgi:hypothetical protein